MVMRQPYLAATERHGDGASYHGEKAEGSQEAQDAIARVRARLAADSGRKGIRLDSKPAPEPRPRGSTRTDQVMRVIQRLTADGLPTTVRAIADVCAISTSTATYHLDALEGQGAIKRNAGLARSIRPAGAWRLTEDERDTLRAVRDELHRMLAITGTELNYAEIEAFERLVEGR